MKPAGTQSYMRKNMHDSHSPSKRTPGAGRRSQLAGVPCTGPHTHTSVQAGWQLPRPLCKRRETIAAVTSLCSFSACEHTSRSVLPSAWAFAWLPALGHRDNARQSPYTRGPLFHKPDA